MLEDIARGNLRLVRWHVVRMHGVVLSVRPATDCTTMAAMRVVAATRKKRSIRHGPGAYALELRVEGRQATWGHLMLLRVLVWLLWHRCCRVPADGRRHDRVPRVQVHLTGRQGQANLESERPVMMALVRVALDHGGVDGVLVLIGAVEPVEIVDGTLADSWRAIPCRCCPHILVTTADVLMATRDNIVERQVMFDGAGMWILPPWSLIVTLVARMLNLILLIMRRLVTHLSSY